MTSSPSEPEVDEEGYIELEPPRARRSRRTTGGVKVPRRSPYRTRSFLWFGIKVLLAYAVAAPFVVIGIALCMTYIGALIGVPIIMMGSYPVAHVMGRRIKKTVAWDFRDKPLDEDTEPPWDTGTVQVGGRFGGRF